MRFLLLVFLSLIVISCNRHNTNNLIVLLHNPEKNINEINTFCEIHKEGKKIIPDLINSIDTNQKTSVGFIHPLSSTIYLFHVNYAGVLSAYMIEFLLGVEKLECIEVDIYSYEKSPYQIFKYGVIVRKVNDKPVMMPLQNNDMKKIKKYYQTWWEKNKIKSIEELREDWRNDKRALSNTEYIWI